MLLKYHDTLTGNPQDGNVYWCQWHSGAGSPNPLKTVPSVLFTGTCEHTRPPTMKLILAGLLLGAANAVTVPLHNSRIRRSGTEKDTQTVSEPQGGSAREKPLRRAAASDAKANDNAQLALRAPGSCAPSCREGRMEDSMLLVERDARVRVSQRTRRGASGRTDTHRATASVIESSDGPISRLNIVLIGRDRCGAVQ